MSKLSHSRAHIYTPADLAAKAADAITRFVGSWTFVGIHAVWFILWIVFRIEAFPFGLLTLLVSLEAIFLSTFVMMSQNRAAERDHARDDHEAEEVDLLFKINQTQLEILDLLKTEICSPDATTQPTELSDPQVARRIGKSLKSTLSATAASAAATPKPSQRRRR